EGLLRSAGPGRALHRHRARPDREPRRRVSAGDRESANSRRRAVTLTRGLEAGLRTGAQSAEALGWHSFSAFRGTLDRMPEAVRRTVTRTDSAAVWRAIRPASSRLSGCRLSGCRPGGPCPCPPRPLPPVSLPPDAAGCAEP